MPLYRKRRYPAGGYLQGIFYFSGESCEAEFFEKEETLWRQKEIIMKSLV